MSQQAVLGVEQPAGEEGQRPWRGKPSIPSPDEQWGAVAGPEHTVQVWDATQSRHWSTYYGHQVGVYNRRTASIASLAWVDDERVVSEREDGSIHLWWALTGIHLRTFVEAGQPRPSTLGSVHVVVTLVVSEEGSKS